MAARATISQAGSVVSSVNNNAITARLKRQLYKDVWPWTFLRNSVDGALGINVPRLGANGEIRVMEGTQNLLPAGAENFVTGWTNGIGETCTVTDYPINIPGVGDVIAKRIVGDGAGNSTLKRSIFLFSLSNPHTVANSVWAMTLSANNPYINDASSTAPSVTIPAQMSRIVIEPRSVANTGSYICFRVPSPTDILDIVVYAPQIEAKPYATDYVAPGATRAAESLTVPASVVNAAAGTVEFDFVTPGSWGLLANFRCLFLSRYDGNNTFAVYTFGSALYLTTTINGNTVNSSYSANLLLNTKYRIALKYSASRTSLWVSGARVGAEINISQLLYAGSVFVGTTHTLGSQSNGLYSNLRISNIARSDTEMAYTGPLKADQFTTFFAPWSIT